MARLVSQESQLDDLAISCDEYNQVVHRYGALSQVGPSHPSPFNIMAQFSISVEATFKCAPCREGRIARLRRSSRS